MYGFFGNDRRRGKCAGRATREAETGTVGYLDCGEAIAVIIATGGCANDEGVVS